jgi:hypothetical protein
MLFSLLQETTAPDFWVKGIMYIFSVFFSGVMVKKKGFIYCRGIVCILLLQLKMCVEQKSEVKE